MTPLPLLKNPGVARTPEEMAAVIESNALIAAIRERGSALEGIMAQVFGMSEELITDLNGNSFWVLAKPAGGGEGLPLPQLWTFPSGDGISCSAGSVVWDNDNIFVNSDGMGGVVVTRSGDHANVEAVKDAASGTVIDTPANYADATELWLIIATSYTGYVTEAYILTEASGADAEYDLSIGAGGLYSIRLCHTDAGEFVRDWGGGPFPFGGVEVENTGYTILP